MPKLLSCLLYTSDKKISQLTAEYEKDDCPTESDEAGLERSKIEAALNLSLIHISCLSTISHSALFSCLSIFTLAFSSGNTVLSCGGREIADRLRLPA